MEVTPGFLLLIVTAWYLDEGVGIFLWAVAACVVHELGHAIAVALVKGRIRGIRLSAVGIEMHLAQDCALSYGEENVIALAGPIANLLMAVLACRMRGWIAAATSAVIGVFNLFPVLPLDGGRVLHNILLSCLNEPWPERILMVTAGIFTGVLCGAGLIGFAVYGNVSLLLTSGWLLFKNMKSFNKKGK